MRRPMIAMLALTEIALAGSAAWRPPPRLIRSEWCERHIRLPAETSAEPGALDLTDRCYFREPIDAVDDPGVRELVLIGATQIGKTTFTHCIVLSQGDLDRAPMMFAGPDEIYAREQGALLYSLADASPILRPRVPAPRFRNHRQIDLGASLIYLAWSGSTQRLSGRACQKVICSEADRWRATIHLARKRVMAFRSSSTVIIEGAPIGASTTITPLYEQSDRRTFQVPCPHCGHYQELRFFPHRGGPYDGAGGVAGLQDDAGRWRTPEEARRRAHYLCERGCAIQSEDKLEMVRRGMWVPAGCHVDVRGKLPALAGKPANPGRRRGYRINALYSPAIGWGDAAEEYLRVRDTEDGLASFFNDWLALPFRPRGKTPRWEDLGRRLAGAVPRGVIPPWAYFVTAGADVQETCVYWVVRAWGDGCTSALVDWGRLERRRHGDETELASDLKQLDEAVLGRKWPISGGANPLGYRSLAVCRLGIDSGWRPTEVYGYVRGRQGDRVWAVAGDPKILPGTLYRLQNLEKNARTGEPYPDGTQRWGIDTAAYKSDITGRWTSDRRRPGVWWLPSDVLEAGEDYLRQITNERRVTRYKAGKKQQHWEVITEATGNHYFDAEVYARAMADQVVGQVWTAADWPWTAPRETAPRDGPAETDFSAR